MKGDPAIVLSALAVLNFLAVPVVLFVRLKCCRPEPPSDLADGDCFPVTVMRGDFKVNHSRRSNP